jgi:hypothetical protein
LRLRGKRIARTSDITDATATISGLRVIQQYAIPDDNFALISGDKFTITQDGKDISSWQRLMALSMLNGLRG